METNERYLIYSKDNCSFCQQAKSLLLIKGKPFKEFKLNVDYSLEEFISKFPDHKTFPMIVLETNQPYHHTNKETVEYNIGGFQQLKEYLS